MDKYQMIDEIVVLIDRLADARGIDRCVILIDLVKRMNALKDLLREDESAHESRINLLKNQIRNLTTPPPLKDGEIREGGETYTIDLTPKDGD